MVNNIGQLQEVLRKEFEWATNDENMKMIGRGQGEEHAKGLLKLANEAIDSLTPTYGLTVPTVTELTDNVFRKISRAYDYIGSEIENYIVHEYIRPNGKFGTRNIRKDIQGQLRGLRIHLGNKYNI